MTDSPDDNPSEPIPEVEAEPAFASTDKAENPEKSVEDPLQQLKDRATEMLRNGANEAREAIESRIPQVQNDMGRGMGEASYGVGYALKFASTLLKEFAPEDLNSGYKRGSEAGEQAAEVVINDRRDRQNDNDTPVDEPSPAS